MDLIFQKYLNFSNFAWIGTVFSHSRSLFHSNYPYVGVHSQCSETRIRQHCIHTNLAVETGLCSVVCNWSRETVVRCDVVRRVQRFVHSMMVVVEKNNKNSKKKEPFVSLNLFWILLIIWNVFFSFLLLIYWPQTSCNLPPRWLRRLLFSLSMYGKIV